MTDLVKKQVFFFATMARFVFDGRALGYLLTCGEFWRSPETCELYAKAGKGIKNSNHPNRICGDLEARTLDGNRLTTFKEWESLGILWESYSTDEYKCVWGGRFKSRLDVWHFGIEHNGVR